MPCYTVQTTTLDMSKAQPDILKAALETLGYTVSIRGANVYAVRMGAAVTWSAGSLQVSANADTQTVAQEIQRTYAAQIVKTASAKFGWQVTEKAPGKLQVQRRF
jgi:hypothetical protein